MTDHNVLGFLEAYKELDELCKQIFSSARGISEYIDKMDMNGHGYRDVSCWNTDYRQLKRLRWIRNKLVHEINSFEDDLFSSEDILWLNAFQSRILERTDPLVLFRQMEMNRIKTSDRHGGHIRTETSSHPPAFPQIPVMNRIETSDRHGRHITSSRPSEPPKIPVWESLLRYAVWAGVLLFVVMLFLFYTQN